MWTALNIFLIHYVSCVLMTGIIWFVQWLHYPSFTWVDKEKGIQFSHFHQSQTTYLVAPIMLTEAFTCVLLLYQFANSPFSTSSAFLVASVFMLLNWMSTALISVPLHHQLSCAFEEKIISRLVTTNWLRTAFWSIRTALLTYFLTQCVKITL